MMLTDLSKAVQKSGLVVHEVSGWKSRGRGPMVAVDGIVEHHTAGPKRGNMPSLGVLVHGRSDLPGPLCNLGFARDGSVYVVAAGKANHAGVGHGFGLPANNANPRMIGIEAESTGYGDWTAAQLAAWPRLNNALMGHYHFPDHMIIGHLEWTVRKIDPHGLPGGMAALRAASKNATGGDDDMLTIRTGSHSKPQTIQAGKWTPLIALDPGPYSVAAGPVDVIGGQIYLDVADLAPGSTLQVRAYAVSPPKKAGGLWVTESTFGIGEHPGTTGQTFVKDVVTGHVPKGQRLRFQAILTGQDKATISSVSWTLPTQKA